MSSLRLIAAAALLVAGLAVPATAGATAPSTSGPTVPSEADARENASVAEEPRIAGVFPNPVADGDRGEFVVLDLPAETDLRGFRLSDGDGRLAPANVTVDGRVAVTADPAAVRNLTDLRVVGATGGLALANGGEQISLSRDDQVVATAKYRDAPEGEIGRYDRRGALSWESLGTTDRRVVSATGGTARAFVLPDAPEAAVEVIRGAEDRVRLAGYTFASRQVATELERAAGRGVDVRVLLEGEPVDGISRRQARILDSLIEAGVTVKLVGGPYGRYAFHHAKYAVVDDRAVVLTENWKPAGTGGRSSRGWGAVVDQSRVVRGLASTFEADAEWRGARPWRRVRQGRTFRETTAANSSYPTRLPPEEVPVERTRLAVAPDNAGRSVVAALDNATESIDVIQMSIDGPDQRFLEATVRAARRGVDVRILLSGAWYAESDNGRLVEHLRDVADREDLPLEAKLASPDGRFEKIHAKGVVVDGDQVILGSLNWNGESVAQNREVLLLLDGSAVGSYYRSVFESDWGSSESDSLPVGLIAAVAGSLLLAGLVARRLEFGTETGVGP